MTSSVLQMGLCAHCASHLPPSEYLKVWFEGMSGGPCLLHVCGAGGRSAHAERADERLCVCVSLGSISVRIHPAKSLFNNEFIVEVSFFNLFFFGINFSAAGVVSQSDSRILDAVKKGG